LNENPWLRLTFNPCHVTAGDIICIFQIPRLLMQLSAKNIGKYQDFILARSFDATS
jgi:hypothetical protein